MGKDAPSPPPAPDPVRLARAQSQANIDAALATAGINQFNQISPFGNLTFSGTIGEPDRTRTVTLNPLAQQALDAQLGLSGGLSGLAQSQLGRIGDTLNTPFTLDGLPAAPRADDAARQRIEAGLFGRLEPLLQRDQEALNTRLANQGIPLGSEAFQNAQGDLARARNDARLAVLGQGGAEQSRQFGLETAARNSALAELLLQRSQPLNEASALIQGAPAIPTPQFGQTGQIGVGPADVLGANQLAQNAQLAQFQADTARQNALFGGLAGLGGAFLSAGLTPAAGSAGFLLSDIRVKTDLELIGKLANGVRVYTFRYINDPEPRVGVMAQEVEQVIPDAVHEIEGVKHVDYIKVLSHADAAG